MDVIIRCPYCNYSKTIKREAIPENVRWARCPICKERFELDLEQSSTQTLCAWEQREDKGIFKAAVLTLREVIFHPSRFFKSIANTENVLDSLIYGILIGSLGNMAALFWDYVFLARGIKSIEFPFTIFFGTPLLLSLVLIAVPLFVFIEILLASLFYHVLLWLVRGGKGGLGATVRVISYSQSCQMWGIVPFIGAFIGKLYILYVQFVGLKIVHNTSYLRITVALCLPLFFMLFLLLAIILYLF